jgi:putative peptidoglycan lipid II flippase
VSTQQIIRGAIFIFIGNGLSRLLGLARIQVIAALFGVTAATSAFQTASAVPTMVYDLLIGGAISAALIPVLSGYVRTGDEREFGRVAGSLVIMAVLCLGLAALAIAVFAPAIVAVLGVSRNAGPAVEAEAIGMVRLVAPSVLFLGLAGVATALLYSRQVFGYATYSQAAFNFGIIAMAFILAPWLGVTGLIVGVLIGSALQLGLQLPGLRQVPFDWRPDFRHPGVRRALKLYLPVGLGLVVSQIGIIIDRNLAWQTGEESVAVMAVATTLVQLPLGLAATATAFAVLPALSRAAESETTAEFRSLLALGFRLALLAVMPAMVGLVVIRELVFRVLFERGMFDAAATVLTAKAFLVYAPQMPFWAIDQLLIFAFYARRDTVTPVTVGVVGVFIYLGAAFSLVGPFGLFGLVAANTIQNSLHAVILLVIAWRRFGSLTGLGLGGALGRILFASLAMGLAMWGAAGAWLGLAPGPDFRLDVARVAVLGGIGAVAYLAVLQIFGAPELRAVTGMIRRRVSAGAS